MSEVKKIATRESYGNALVEIGKEHEDLVVLDADLAGATKTAIFQKVFPERHIDCGIAEGNMMGVAAGLATTGKVPFASSFAMFAAGRAFEQIRNSIGYPHLNVKIGATHAGISVGEDGATHQCNEDIALMRMIPGMVIINPADDVEARAAVKAAYEYVGPVYMRFGRLAIPVFNDESTYKFELGKGVVLREGSDVAIFATGLEVYESMQAAELLAADGINAKVINIHTIKPLDEELVVASAKECKKVVTVEEHSIIGGLGSAVCDTLCANYPTPVLKIGVNDVYGESGPAAYINFMTVIDEHLEFIRMMVRENGVREFLSEEEVRSIWKNRIPWLPTLLKRKMEAGEVKEMDFEMAALSVNSILMHYVMKRVTDTGHSTLDDKAWRKRLVDYQVSVWSVEKQPENEKEQE